MIGDGVNDVLSLKKAHIGVAMQSGSAATRGVADIILLKDSFAALPNAFMEGQRILNGMEDVIRLFLTRALYAALIIMGTAVVAEAQLFPFIPKHASLITLLTVGLPTFMLAAWARPGVPKASLVRSITRFVLPAAATVSVVGLSVYSFYLLNYYRPAPPGTEAVAINISRTALTTVTVLMGLVLIAFVEPPTPWWVAGDDLSGDWRPTLVGLLMLGIYVLINVYEPLRTFFELEVLHPVDYVLLTSVTVLWTLLLRLIWRAHLFERFLGVDNSALRGMRRSGS
jgi:cation-transporting ATPase E